VADGVGGRVEEILSGWHEFEERADGLYGGGEISDVVLDAYAGAALTRVADRHAFVTEDPRLLEERGQHPWADVNVLNVDEAVALVALLMRHRGRCDLFYGDLVPVERDDSSRFYGQLADVLADAKHDLLDVVDVVQRIGEGTYELLLSFDSRINDLLVARDAVRIAALAPHGGAMLASALYHLRAAVQTAGALLESVAVLATEQLAIQTDPLTATFRRPQFRRAVADADGTSVAAIVSGQRYLALSFFVSELRGSIGHGHGLSGVTDIGVPVVVSRVSISPAQAAKLKQLYRERREPAEAWGFRDGPWPSLDPDVFSDQLLRAVVEAFDETARALVADLRRLHPEDSRLTASWKVKNERFVKARAAMPADERAKLEGREAEERRIELDYERKTLGQLALHGGFRDWDLLSRLMESRTQQAASEER